MDNWGEFLWVIATFLITILALLPFFVDLDDE